MKKGSRFAGMDAGRGRFAHGVPAETGTSAPQAEAVSDLHITAEGVPVEVRLAADGPYRCEYDDLHSGPELCARHGGLRGELPDPAGHDKALAFTGSASSGSLSMTGVEDFAVSAEISTSMVSVPIDWPAYDMLSFDSAHTSGNGAAKTHIDRISSSFVFE